MENFTNKEKQEFVNSYNEVMSEIKSLAYKTVEGRQILDNQTSNYSLFAKIEDFDEPWFMDFVENGQIDENLNKIYNSEIMIEDHGWEEIEDEEIEEEIKQSKPKQSKLSKLKNRTLSDDKMKELDNLSNNLKNDNSLTNKYEEDYNPGM